jgi:eukaryotic-like serine/threonine-protein kinase
MELVTGGDLSQHAKPETLLPVPDVLQIAFKCCGALDYAAKEGIVHRDIKPANIMIAGGTEVKIADFGAAMLKKSQVVQTAALGSPYYMSPEQVQGKTLTFHTDMYSLGVVLYELLTGTRPFVGDNIDVLLGKILKAEPAPPSEVRQGLHKAIDSVVLRALKKDPAHRYRTWPEFALELSKVGELVLPAGAIPDSEKYVTLKRVPMLAPLADSELWELARAGKWTRVAKGKPVVQEDQKGRSFFFLARGDAKVIKNKKLLNMVGSGECFGEMAYIGGGEQPRHATVEAMTDLLLAEFEPAALDRMSLGAQLQLTRALVRNVTDRLALANVRLVR